MDINREEASPVAVRRASRAASARLGFALLLASVLLLGIARFLRIGLARASNGPLGVEIIAAYNLVVDSNVGSPSTYAPSVATVIGRFCNSGGSTLTGVQGFIGDYDDITPGNSTPGIYPSRDSTQAAFQSQHPVLANTGSYAFTHVGGRIGTADATRFVGTLQPGECKVQYWHFTYPRCSDSEEPPCSGSPVWGDSVKPDDDLWLEFDMWATSSESEKANATWRMTMRNEISAMANKIEPEGNPGGEWFNTEDDVVRPGEVITSNGVHYELGNVRHGFDNDGDFVPDYNAWLQPIGDPSYDPSCFRLIHTQGVLTISRGAGKPDLIFRFDDRDPPHATYGGPLYFTNLPPDNNGVEGNVHYTFLAIDGPCATTLSPYQEVASGYDNEKFNGDYGGAMPPVVGSSEPEVEVDKSGNVTVTTSSWMTYTVDFENTGDEDVGLPLASMPVVISDTLPSDTSLGSSSASVGVTPRYSTDGGQTFTTTKPSSGITTIQWWLSDTLGAGADGIITFSVWVSPTASGFIENCADASFGAGTYFDRDCTTTMVEGSNQIGDYVWRDEDSDGVQDGSETGIDGVTVSLYWDVDGDGVLDVDDSLIVTATTGGGGGYLFDDLPNGDFIVAVDEDDPDIPPGYRHTTDVTYATTLSNSDDLNADFGFGPSLDLEKALVGGSGYEGQEVVYNLTVRSLRPGGGETVDGGCRYTIWAGRLNLATDTPASGSGNKAWLSAGDSLGAPDDAYAYTELANNADTMALAGFNLVPQAGNILTVELEMHVKEIVELRNNDHMEVTIYLTDTARLPVFDYDGLNHFMGAAGDTYIFTEDVTSKNPSPWRWSHFSNDTTELLVLGDKGGGSPGTIGFDGAAFHITTDSPCTAVEPDDVITTVPLTDTYDTFLLEFVSASPPQSSIDTVNGVITWTNVGPIYPGGSAVVRVTFLGLEPPGASATVTNTTCVIGASFSDSRPTNDDCASETGIISPTRSISGTVWSDIDADGWQGSTGYEGGTDLFIPGVAAELYLCDGMVTSFSNQTCLQNGGTWLLVDTQMADANGDYLFSGLVDGYYYVLIDTSTIPGAPGQTGDADEAPTYTCTQAPCSNTDSRWQHEDADIGDMHELNATTGDIGDRNFGYSVSAAIYGTVWEDVDGDGTREDGEDGLGDGSTYVTVNLHDSNGVLTATAHTTATGYYSFTGLSPGTYTITVVASSLPPGGSWTQTDDPDVLLDDEHTVTVAAGEVSGSHDFGYHRHSGPYSLGDTVYTDWNGDGDQDTGEEGVSGVTVTLYEDEDGDGAIDSGTDAFISNTATSGTGIYAFTGLVTGTYIVVVDESGLPAWDDYNETQDPDEAGVCTTCDSMGSGAVSSTLTTNNAFDYGYQPIGFGSIGDYVWKDTDRDGIQDTGESGIANITVSLYEDNGNGVYDAGVDGLVMTTTTDANGNYSFEYLPAGDYLVDADTTDSDLPTDSFSNPYVLTTDNDPHPVTLSTGENYEDADFGFGTGGMVGDYIWQDNDGDAIQDPDEPGIGGVTVTLYIDVNGNGDYDSGTDTLYDSMQTDASGIYSFTGVVSDTYVIVVDTGSIPGGYQQTGDPDVKTVCSGGDCDSESGFNLRAGQIDVTRDFGYQPSRSLGDYVWLDLDGDGVQDSTEPGIGSVVLTLTKPSAAVVTTTTDSDGYYSFGGSDLTADGTYSVTVDVSTLLSTAMTPTYDLDDGIASPNGEAGISISGATFITDVVDFGFRYDGQYLIAGHVFFDASGIAETNDTYQSGTDSPYSGITVYLWNSDLVQIGTMTTTATGAFTFTDLPAGVYTVSINADSPQLDGLDLTAASSYELENYHTVSVVASDVTDVDFGFYAAVDFGDLPGDYDLTVIADEGAYHTTGSLYLGASVDTEGDGAESVDATGDGADEDGVTRHPGDLWLGGSTVRLTVTVTGSNGYLVGWFDWNDDDDFGDSGERVIFGSVSAGTNSVNLTVASGFDPSATPFLLTRFRLYDGNPSAVAPTGAATNGEVEDYRWEFSPTAVTMRDLRATGVPRTRAVVLALAAAVVLGGVLVVTRLGRRRAWRVPEEER